MKLTLAILAAGMMAFATHPVQAGAAATNDVRVAKAGKFFDDVSSNGKRQRVRARRKVYVDIAPRACNSVIFYRSPACSEGIVTFGPYGWFY